MLNQFSRSELVLGKEAIKKLQNSRVAVFGLGGVGGYVLEALVRAGVGSVDIVDSDTVNITNINRQLVALHSNVGMLKTDAWEIRIKDINPLCNVVKHNCFYLPESSGSFNFDSYGYVIDAIDTVTAKIDLAVRCSSLGIKLISSMGTGNKTDPTMFKIADIYSTKVCPLARVMRNELKKRNVKSLKVLYSEEQPVIPDKEALEEYLKFADNINNKAVPGSVSFVPSVAGLIIAGEVIKDLLDLRNKTM